MTECSKDKILRKSYSKKVGSKLIKVKANCIKSTSQSGNKRSTIDKKIIKQKQKIAKIARKKFGTPKCKDGEVIKEGYQIKKTSKWVKPTCIKSVSGSGKKSEQLFVLEKDDLKPFGYENVEQLTKTQRHRALIKALSKIKPLSLMRKLVALSVLNKNRNPELSKIFADDSDFIKTTEQYANR